MHRGLQAQDDEVLDDEKQPRFAFYQIDVIDLVRDIWNGRYLILVFLVAAFAWSIISIGLAQPDYTASTLVGPPERESDQGLSGALGQAAGAASLFGIGLGGLNSTVFTKYSSVLESYQLAAAVMKHDEVKPILFGPSWVPKTRSWTRPTGLVFEIKDFLKGILGMPQWAPPTAYTVHDKLSSLMVLTPDKMKGYLTISVRGNTPAEALLLLKVIYQEADELLRQATKQRSEGRIKYLNAELRRETLQDQRQAIINLLSDQDQKLMMASADPNVAIEVLDPPRADPVPSSPKPRQVLLANAMFAVMCAVLITLIYGLRYRRDRRKAVAQGYSLPQPQRADIVVWVYVRELFWRVVDRFRFGRSSTNQSNHQEV